MTIEPTPPLLELLTAPDLDEAIVDRAPLDVRSFAATEAISTLFQVRVTAHHTDASIDFEEIVGAPAIFRVSGHGAAGAPMTRTWTGVVSQMEQTRAVGGERTYSSYELSIVPKLWLLTQRRNYRIFQFKSELAIALELLAEWGIVVEARLDPGAYRARKYKVQYGETDYEFLYRILADVGISFFFEMGKEETTLVLSDAPHRAPKLPVPIDFEDAPNLAGGKSFVTNLHRSQRVRPTSVLLRDRDYRRDSGYELQAGARAVDDDERDLALYDRRMELFYYPENFNFVDEGEDAATPYADSRGLSRTDEGEAKRMALIDLQARRNDAAVVEFDTGDLRMTHGAVFTIQGHPADEINHAGGFLVVESRTAARFDSPVQVSCEAVSARWPYRPTLAPKPRIIGLESATVVGAAGEEIDCDEFGRVKVHFHWDRYSKRNEESSCWIPVSQTWGGAGMGGVQIPRIGQEVLVEFLAGDPDRPIVTGRVFTAVNKVPIKLPAAKTQTILQSQSTGGGGGHNMIRMEDNCGLEEVFIRAQKDMNAVILNNYSTSVGNDRSAAVTGHDSVTADKTRTVKSGAGMTLNAGVLGAADLTATATQNVSLTAAQAMVLEASTSDMALVAKETLGQSAKTILLTAEERIVLAVGTTMLVLAGDCAVLQSKQTFINPGEGEAAKTAATGIPPETDSQKKQADQEFEALDRQSRGEYLTNVEQFPLNDQKALLDKRTSNRNAAIEKQMEGLPQDDPNRAARKQRLEELYPPPRSPYWDKRREAPRAIL